MQLPTVQTCLLYYFQGTSVDYLSNIGLPLEPLDESQRLVAPALKEWQEGLALLLGYESINNFLAPKDQTLWPVLKTRRSSPTCNPNR